MDTIQAVGAIQAVRAIQAGQTPNVQRLLFTRDPVRLPATEPSEHLAPESQSSEAYSDELGETGGEEFSDADSDESEEPYRMKWEALKMVIYNYQTMLNRAAGQPLELQTLNKLAQEVMIAVAVDTLKAYAGGQKDLALRYMLAVAPKRDQ